MRRCGQSFFQHQHIPSINTFYNSVVINIQPSRKVAILLDHSDSASSGGSTKDAGVITETRLIDGMDEADMIQKIMSADHPKLRTNTRCTQD